MPSGAHTPLPPHTPGPFQSTELQSVAMAVPSSQTISDKLHHAFAYFLQFVFVRTKRIETNAISAQKTHKKRREKAEQKSSKTRESTRRIKIKPNKGVPATPPPPCRILSGSHCAFKLRCRIVPIPSAAAARVHTTLHANRSCRNSNCSCNYNFNSSSPSLYLSLPLSLCPSARCLFTLFAICCAFPPPPYMP